MEDNPRELIVRKTARDDESELNTACLLSRSNEEARDSLSRSVTCHIGSVLESMYRQARWKFVRRVGVAAVETDQLLLF